MRSCILFRPTWLVLWVIVNLDVSVASHRGKPVMEIFSWKSLSWDIANQGQVRSFDGERFQFENGIPLATALWRDKLFIVVPRWLPGIPATLNYVPINSRVSKSPKLIPYPSLDCNNERRCEAGIVTASRIHVDECNRLWAFDTGNEAIENRGMNNRCPAALKIFDLTTDELVRSHAMQPTVTSQATFITNIAVEIGRGDCSSAYAYITDEIADSLIVYDWKYDRSWRIPIERIPNLISHSVKQVVFGMALSPVFNRNGQRLLFFHPHNGREQFVVGTDDLKSWNRVRRPISLSQVRVNDIGVRSSIQVMDKSGTMYYNLIDERTIGCQRLDGSNMIHARVFDKDDLRICDHMMIDDGYMWITSRTLTHSEAARNEHPHDNFRILLMPLKQAFAGTPCDPDASLSTYSAYDNLVQLQGQLHNRASSPSAVLPRRSFPVPRRNAFSNFFLNLSS